MAMKRDGDVQPDLIVSWSDIPRSPGHAFYDKLQKLLAEAGFDRFVESCCEAHYAPRMGAPSVPPGWYFRVLLIGYFEGSPTDPDAKVARMKNGSTRLAYKPEHAVDLDTGVIVAAPIDPADQGDTNTLDPTLEAAVRNLAGIGLAPTSDQPCDLVTDKGYHSREGLKDLEDGVWKTRISEPAPANGILRWHGDKAAQRAVDANRSRLKSGVDAPPCASAARWLNAASPMSWIVAACAAPGCAGERTSTNAI